MNITVIENEPCKLTIKCEADAGLILDKRAEVLNTFRRAPVKGFREGKAPLDAIKMVYRDQIEESLKRALAEHCLQESIFEHKLRPHGAPRFNAISMLDGKFSCEFDLSTKPNFELVPYTDLQIPLPHQSNLDADRITEQTMQDLRVKFGEVNTFSDTDTVMMGDNVILDYQAFVDGEAVSNLSGNGEMMIVGSSAVDGFDANLLGLHVGEEREFELKAPPTSLPSLAGKVVKFKVSLTMGSKTTPAALDDELAKQVGYPDMPTLRNYIQGLSTAKVQQIEKQARHNAIATRLVEDNQFAVPNWMALSEAQYLVHQGKMEWDSLADVDKESYLQMGSKNIKLALILDRLRELEPEAQLNDQEVFNIVKQHLVQTQKKDTIDDTIKQWQSTGYLQVLFSRIKDEYTMDFLVKKTQFTE